MIWFYERAGEKLRITTRFDDATKEYVLEVEWPGQPLETERYADVAAFDTRIGQLEDQLMDAHWEQARRPSIVPTGWRGPISHNSAN